MVTVGHGVAYLGIRDERRRKPAATGRPAVDAPPGQRIGLQALAGRNKTGSLKARPRSERQASSGRG
nr:sperm flagella 2 protein [Aureimonas sp. AU12]